MLGMAFKPLIGYAVYRELAKVCRDHDCQKPCTSIEAERRGLRFRGLPEILATFWYKSPKHEA